MRFQQTPSTKLIVIKFIFIVGVTISNRAFSSKIIRVFLGEVSDSKGIQLPIATDTEKLMRHIAAETKLKFEISLLPWKMAQLYARNGQGIIYGLSKSPERIELYDFSVPVVIENV